MYSNHKMLEKIEEKILDVIADLKLSLKSPSLNGIERSKKNAIYTDSIIQLGDLKRTTKFSDISSVGRFTKKIAILSIIHRNLLMNQECSLRDLYYQLFDIFQNQSEVKECVLDIGAMFDHCPLLSLGFFASSKGFIAGNLQWNVFLFCL